MAAVTTDSILGPASLPIFLPGTGASGGRTPQKCALCLCDRGLSSRQAQLIGTQASVECAAENGKARRTKSVQSTGEAARVTVPVTMAATATATAAVEGLRMEGLRTERKGASRRGSLMS